MYTPDDSNGPAITCPGRPWDESCDDYPDGACAKCVQRADDERKS